MLLAALTPVYFVICALLAIAGAGKILAPEAAKESVALVGLSVPTAVVRALGGGELMLAGLAAIWPTPVTSGLVAVAYGTFWAFVLLLLRSTARPVDCGCFGGADNGVGRLHLALNALACVVAAAAAAVGAHGIGWIASRPPLIATSLTIGALAATYAAYVAYTVVPRAWGSYESGGAR